MRIAIVTHEYPPIGGGGATAAAQLAENLASKGHTVCVFTAGYREANVTGRDGNSATIEISYLGRKRRNRNSPTVFELSSFLISSYRTLRNRLAGFGPDAVIAFFAIPSGWLAARAMRGQSIPLLVSIRGSDAPGFPNARFRNFSRLLHPIIRWTIREADLVVPNSSYLGRLIAQFDNTATAKIVVIRNGADHEFLKYEPHTSPDTDVLRLVQVGRLIPRKQIMMTLQALGELRASGFAASLTIIGEGPQEKAIRHYVTQYKLGECVEITGHLSRSELRRRLTEFDIFVMTSAAEGTSNAMLEAMACGIPVLTTKNGSHELIDESGAGHVLANNTADELFRAIVKIGMSPAWRESCRQAARDYCERHTWQHAAQQFLDAIEKARVNRGKRR